MERSKSVIKEKNFIYIIGAPRSGTTWLQTVLGAHPDVATTVELTLFHRYIAPWVQAWEEEKASIESEKWFLGQPFIWEEEEFRSFLNQFLEKSYSKVAEKKPEASCILDKHPGYTFHTDLINRFVPQAKFIHLIRDGRKVANSLVKIREKLGEGYGTKEFDTAALSWKQFVSEARKAEKYEGRYLEVRYEDLLADTENKLGEVLNFCGIESNAEFLKKTVTEYSYDKMKESRASQDKEVRITSAHFNQDSEKNSVYQNYLFSKVSGDLLVELGYEEKRDWWSRGAADKLWIPLYHKLKVVGKKLG